MLEHTIRKNILYCIQVNYISDYIIFVCNFELAANMKEILKIAAGDGNRSAENETQWATVGIGLRVHSVAQHSE